MIRRIIALAFAALLIIGVIAVPAQAATDAEIEQSIQNGLAWLDLQQQGDGSWQGGNWGPYPEYDVATTGLAVLKFEDRAKELGLDPFDTVNYMYADNVINGLDYIFSNVTSDANGVHFGNFFLDVYNTGIAMMAVAASNNPGRLITTGPLAPATTYQQALQGMLDWMAFAQNGGADIYTGGWPYNPTQTDWADNSVSGYATIGIGYAAAAPPSGFGLTILATVPAGLNTFIGNVQVVGGLYDGGSLYNPGWVGGPYWINTLKTGNLIYELALTGAPVGDPRVTSALNFIGTYWGAPGGEYDGAGWLGDYQAMFTMMKGLQAYGLNDVPGHPNWFDEVSTYIVSNQAGDGSWLSTTGEVTWSATLSTAFALLTLEKAVPPVVEPEDEGFMTGGGNITVGKGKNVQRYTWGFEIRCDGSQGNFQYNDHTQNGNFHLESITSVTCTDDPAIEPNPPTAHFDTLTLTGTGRWNGVSGATIEVTLTDAGEPGRNDTINLTIKDANNVVVSSISGNLNGGNHQAHDSK